MRRLAATFVLMIALFAAGAFLVGSLATTPAEARPDCNCLDIWNPVICDGVVYSNICYARCAGAHHCSPYGEI